jgi:hypothetical protein
VSARVPIKAAPVRASQSAARGVLQRKCACGGGGAAGPSGACEQCSKSRLQRKPAGAEKTDIAPPIVHEVLRSPGEPLDAATRAFMEPRLGHDFSRVRIHRDARAAESARAVNALAYTVGRDVVFAAGQYEPAAERGRKLLAHELTHTIQQSAYAPAAVTPPDQITVEPADTMLERAAEERAGGLTARPRMLSPSPNIALQRAPAPEAKSAPALDERKRTDQSYAFHVHGKKDAERIKQSGRLTPEHKQEIIAKLRFFEGKAKAAYIQAVSPALIEHANDEVREIMNVSARPAEALDVTCDLSKHQYLLHYEGEYWKDRCMDVATDPEYVNNYFDRNIKNAVGYSVEGTTWENVEYSRFKVMQVNYKNGTSDYFALDEIGNFHYAKTVAVTREYAFLKRNNGLVYPVREGELYLVEFTAPNLLEYKNGLKQQIVELQRLYELLELAGLFAGNLGNYGAAGGGPGPGSRSGHQGFTRLKSPRRTTPKGGAGTDERTTPMRLPEETTKKPTKQAVKTGGEETRSTVVKRADEDPTGFKGGEKKAPAKKGGKEQREERVSKTAGKKGDEPEDAKGGKKRGTADEPKKTQTAPKAKPIDEPKPKPEPTEKSAAKPEGGAKMTDAEKAKRLEAIKQERTQNDTRMRELEEKIGGAKERHRDATAKAASAKTEAERNAQLDKARRNKESEQKWKEEQDALRMRNNKLRDEERGLAPPKLAPKSWQEAEGSLRGEFGGQKKTLSTATKDGDLGERDIDCFTPDKVSREAKFGRQKYSPRLQEEINKDVALKKAGRVSRNEWHFYENPDTGIGPDSTLKRALDAADIKIVIKK